MKARVERNFFRAEPEPKSREERAVVPIATGRRLQEHRIPISTVGGAFCKHNQTFSAVREARATSRRIAAVVGHDSICGWSRLQYGLIDSKLRYIARLGPLGRPSPPSLPTSNLQLSALQPLT